MPYQQNIDTQEGWFAVLGLYRTKLDKNFSSGSMDLSLAAIQLKLLDFGSLIPNWQENCLPGWTRTVLQKDFQWLQKLK